MVQLTTTLNCFKVIYLHRKQIILLMRYLQHICFINQVHLSLCNRSQEQNPTQKIQKWYFWKDKWSCWFLQLIKPKSMCSHKIGFCVNLRAPLSVYKETTVQQLHLNTTLTHHGWAELLSLSNIYLGYANIW